MNAQENVKTIGSQKGCAVNLDLHGRYFAGIKFPVTKKDIIIQAKTNFAPENVITELNESLPERTFTNISDLEGEFLVAQQTGDPRKMDPD